MNILHLLLVLLALVAFLLAALDVSIRRINLISLGLLLWLLSTLVKP